MQYADLSNYNERRFGAFFLQLASLVKKSNELEARSGSSLIVSFPSLLPHARLRRFHRSLQCFRRARMVVCRAAVVFRRLGSLSGLLKAPPKTLLHAHSSSF